MFEKCLRRVQPSPPSINLNAIILMLIIIHHVMITDLLNNFGTQFGPFSTLPVVNVGQIWFL